MGPMRPPAKSLRFMEGIGVVSSGKELWANMPLVYRAQATFHASLLAHLGALWQWSVMRGRVIPQVPPTTPWPPGGPPCPNPR